MKKIVLIGDSIRLGYAPTVRDELHSIAEVWAPEPNSQHSVNVILHFNEWVLKTAPDIVHMNAGLWDIRKVLPNDTANVVPLARYRENVALLLRLARENSKAKFIWATMTPIDQEQCITAHAAIGLIRRVATDVALYNAAAVEECRAAGVEVNDLHQFVLDHNPAAIRTADGVHYTPEGYALLGKQVAAVVRKHV
ncbi:SGNH/GDSL hydrolase family protein [soil metagenome]